jgi:hypothetical protein
LGTEWPRGQWAKPGVIREERVRDEYECERRAVILGRADRPPGALYAECMQARGYERVR